LHKKFSQHTNNDKIFPGIFMMQLSSKLSIDNVVKTDPSDNIFPACALAGSADYIVSGNYHLLDLKSYQSIKIITPRDFYDILITVGNTKLL